MDFATLKQRLGRRRGFDGNEAQLGDFINDAYLTICGRRQTWSWLRRTHQFSTYTPESVTASDYPTTSIYGATFTNGSRAVAAMTTLAGTPSPAHTRSGARLSCPDGTVHRIASHDAGTNAYLEAMYGGANSPALAAGGTPPTYGDSWKIYWDEYPLPAGTAGIEAIVCTGNGFTYHVPEQSLLPQHMKALTVKDYDSYPQYYAIERHTQIPAPDTAPTIVSTATTGGAVATGVYKYKYCYFNTKTQELGPFSPEASVTISSGTANLVNISYVRRADFGVAIYRTKADGSEFFHHRVTSDFSTTTLQDITADTGLGFKHVDLDIGGAPRATNIGSVAPRAVEISGSEHIRLWPPPDEEYVVDVTYFVAPKELALDTDIPAVPLQFQPAILDLAESYALGESENHAAAAQKRNVALEMIERMERDEDSDPGTVVRIGRGELDVYGEHVGSGRWPRTVSTS